MGRPYVVCRPRRRFVSIGSWLDGRDTRKTTFRPRQRPNRRSLRSQMPFAMNTEDRRRPHCRLPVVSSGRVKSSGARCQAGRADSHCHRCAPAHGASFQFDRPTIWIEPRQSLSLRCVALGIAARRERQWSSQASDLEPLLAHRRRVGKVGRRALEHDVAVAHHVEAVRDPERNGELLLD